MSVMHSLPSSLESAAQMLERGKHDALAEAMRLIEMNASQDSVQLHALPRLIALYVHDALSNAGYKVSEFDGPTHDIIWTVSWT